MELTKDKTEILNVYCKGKLQIKFSREQRIYFSTFDSISIFDNKTSNNRISRPHEQHSRFMYNDYKNRLTQFLDKDRCYLIL